MNPIPLETLASRIAELLLYHSVLGNGYDAPFPSTRGMVFTSALPDEAIRNINKAEAMFRKCHEQLIAEDRLKLEQAESQPEHQRAVTGMDKAKMKELKEKVSKRAHIVWTEEQTMKSTIVELLKTHYYGAFTYLDPVGSRLAGALGQPWKLSSDLSWTTLMEGTTEETLIRSGSTGGALIHSLTGLNPIFNFFCSCKEQQLEKLIEKVRNSSHGQVGLGTTVVIRGRPGIFQRDLGRNALLAGPPRVCPR